ncbi:MAG: (d)CMP kinase [Bacteroidota bacterium]
MLENNSVKINIAIDGYSSCGKGTLAKSLAKLLGYRFIDTGAMYRSVTLYFINNAVDLASPKAVEAALASISIDFLVTADGGQEVVLNGVSVEGAIREMRVAERVSEVAALSPVRKKLVAMQQKIGENKGVVMDGRDIGTVVFPDAELKIFMTARPEIRAQRRWNELQANGDSISESEVLANLSHRDAIDSSREDSPLTLTKDYRVLDNSELDREQQLQLALQWVEVAMSGLPAS